MLIRNVIVFGDSLSDIGTKWKTGMGGFAEFFDLMAVSPIGRFSDCRNWTDFMYEEATRGQSLITRDKDESIKNSERHIRLNKSSSVMHMDDQYFIYANYAEGGACGDDPASKKYALGTFKNQIEKFRDDAVRLKNETTDSLKKWNLLSEEERPLLQESPEVGAFSLEDPTLFIIWFGANDLFTAGRPFSEMHNVAIKVAQNGRTALRALAPLSHFIFIGLSSPLTTIRYQERRNEAIAKENRKEESQRALLCTEESQEVFKLSEGVRLFNSTLKKVAKSNSDWVVDLETFITEDSLNQLIIASVGLAQGAEDKPSTDHYSPRQYRKLKLDSKLTVNDKVHPTDRAYELIWKLIRKKIKTAGLTFGYLFESPLSENLYNTNNAMYKKLKDINK